MGAEGSLAGSRCAKRRAALSRPPKICQQEGESGAQFAELHKRGSKSNNVTCQLSSPHIRSAPPECGCKFTLLKNAFAESHREDHCMHNFDACVHASMCEARRGAHAWIRLAALSMADVILCVKDCKY